MATLRDCLAQAKQDASGKMFKRYDDGEPRYVPHSIAELVFESMLDTEATYENEEIFINGKRFARLLRWAVTPKELLDKPSEFFEQE